MVFGHMASDNLDVVGGAYLADKVAHPHADCSCQYWFSILGDPDQVVFEVKERMGCSAIEFHPSSISLERIA